MNKKTINKLLLSTMLLGSLVSFSTIAQAEETELIGEAYCELPKDEGFKFSQDLWGNKRTTCYKAKGNKYKNLTAAQSKNNLYYSEAAPMINQYGPIIPASINDSDRMIYVDGIPGVELESYLTLDDIGKEVKLTIYSNTNKLFVSDEYRKEYLNFIYQRNIYNLYDGEEVTAFDTNPSEENSYLNVENDYINYKAKGEENEGGYIDGFTSKFNVVSDRLSLVFDVRPRFILDEDYDFKAPLLNEKTPTLNIKIEVDGETRFDGPYAAFVPIDFTDDSEETRERSNEIRRIADGENKYNMYYNTSAPEGMKEAIKIFDDFYYPDKPHQVDQNIFANVQSGGLTGGIGSSEYGKGLQTVDVDFGKLTIWEPIKNVTVDNMVSVRDWTGGDGWKLTAKQKDADRNTSLQLGVDVNDEGVVLFNDSEREVITGESKLEPTSYSGEYIAEWGTQPRPGDFNNVIEWTLAAELNEDGK